MMDNWWKHPDGGISLHPLLGWEIAVFPMTAGVRLQYAEREEDIGTEGQAVQLAMTAPQLRELAEVLLRTAQRIEDQPLGTSQ